MKKNFILLIFFLLIGCGKTIEDKELDINKLMKERDYIIIDVRTKDEYNKSNIKGSINIPYDEINENINLDKEKLIFVYCKSGRRSNVAFSKLTDFGFEVYDLGAFDDIDLPKE